MESVWEALKQDNRSGGDRGESCFMCPNDTHCLAVPTTRSSGGSALGISIITITTKQVPRFQILFIFQFIMMDSLE